MNDKNALRSRGSLMLENFSPDDNYALFCLIPKGKGKHAVRINRLHHALANTIMIGRGTAHSAILEYLGLEVTETEAVLSHVRASRAQSALQALRIGLDMEKPGRGIAFLVPLTDAKGLKTIFRYAEDLDHGHPEIAPDINPNLVTDDGIVFNSHDLILAVMGENFTVGALDTARVSGAVGGTILRISDWGQNDNNDILPLKLPLDYDKELLLLVVERSKATRICNAISDYLLSSQADEGFIAGIPVAAIAGLTNHLIVIKDGSVTKA